MILDGWGIGPDPERSAIIQAHTPFTDSLYDRFPNARLVTYGEEVGLPDGQMGNSEVGHMNIGAGRIVYQELARINRAIAMAEFPKEKAIQDLIDYCKSKQQPVHLMGLFSDGGVHSHINHFLAAIDVLSQEGIQVFVHCFLDGRDTDPKSGIDYLKKLQNHIQGKSAKIATVIGRYYAMDRDNRWERIAEAYHLMVNGQGQKSDDPIAAVQESYDAGITDEFIKPIVVIDSQGNPLTTIQNDHAVFFINFRTDRPRQIVSALSQTAYPEHQMRPLDLYMVTMARYDQSFSGIHVVYDKSDIQNTLGEHLATLGKSQLRIAETEKYPHVTFFFSGGREAPFENENRILIHSPKVATYDLKPEMSAYEITEKVIGNIGSDQPDFICLNFANADMVGHTGNFQAAIKAAETVDDCAKQVTEAALEAGYSILIIADHGNSDYMINDDGSPNTAHTMNPVPIIYLDNQPGFSEISDGKLGDIAPTILRIMGLPIPKEMTGDVLVR